MSILGKYIDNVEEQELSNNRGFTLPAVIREDRDSMTMKQAFILSVIIHIAVCVITMGLSFLLLWLGVIVPIAKKPKPKLNDIEFVLVDKEDTPINKNTRYRADRNSRAGGHHDPNQRVSMPSPAPSTPAKQPAAPQAPAKKPAVQPKQQAQPKQAPKTQKSQTPSIIDKITKPKPATVAPAPKAPQPAKPNPPTARPSVKPPTTPKATTKPSSPFQVPVPSGGTKSGSYATGPVSGSGKAANGGSTSGHSGSSGSGKFSPAPSLSPSGKGSGASGTGSKLGGGGSGGGNPGPGNPNGRPGIDALREPDFGPYMRDLQRRIKMNWNPPKGDASKRVVLMFTIAKDGRLLSCRVSKSSGLPSADQAALDAVKQTAPFKPLPVEYKKSSVDIQFTFDYNVFGGTASY